MERIVKSGPHLAEAASDFVGDLPTASPIWTMGLCLVVGWSVFLYKLYKGLVEVRDEMRRSSASIAAMGRITTAIESAVMGIVKDALQVVRTIGEEVEGMARIVQDGPEKLAFYYAPMGGMIHTSRGCGSLAHLDAPAKVNLSPAFVGWLKSTRILCSKCEAAIPP